MTAAKRGRPSTKQMPETPPENNTDTNADNLKKQTLFLASMIFESGYLGCTKFSAEISANRMKDFYKKLEEIYEELLK